jgi:hypothetical protein
MVFALVPEKKRFPQNRDGCFSLIDPVARASSDRITILHLYKDVSTQRMIFSPRALFGGMRTAKGNIGSPFALL